MLLAIVRYDPCMRLQFFVFYNQYFIYRLTDFATKFESKVLFADSTYCTDNAVMIANAAIERLEADIPFQNGLYLETLPTWSLEKLHI